MRVSMTPVLALLALASVLVGCSSKEEPDDGNVVRFEDARTDASDPLIRADEAIVQDRTVHFELDQWLKLAKEGETTEIELFQDARVPVRVSSVEQLENEQIQLNGEVPGDELSIVWLSVLEDSVIGTIQTGGRFFDLFPAGPGLIRITEYDQSEFPPDHDAAGQIPAFAFARRESLPRDEVATRIPSPIIRVLLVFPESPYRRYCSSRVLAGLGIAISNEINKIWRNAASADVVARCVTYAPQGQLLIDYLDAGNDLDDYETDTGESKYADYKWLQTDPGIAQLRDRLKADLVAMVLPAYNWCGSAKTNDPPVVPANETNAHAVVRFDCVRGNYSLQHELGHLVGMRHDRIAEKSDLPGNCNYGYICRRTTNIIGRTVMAYGSSCISAGGTVEQCKPRLPIYSHASSTPPPYPPFVVTCGQPCTSTGTTDETAPAANYNQLRQAAPTVSQFR